MSFKSSTTNYRQIELEKVRMKTAYLSTSKRVIHFLAVVVLVVAVAVAPPTAQESPGDGSDHNKPLLNKEVEPVGATPSRFLSMGPGRVSFRLSPAGNWMGLVPGWSDGRDVVTGGGFVVLAKDEGGKTFEAVNTTAKNVRAREYGLGIGPVYEGIQGGARYPLANSDDDGDGSEDEDRLDGVDNDGDGLIDEDFAAVGDEMLTLGYRDDGATLDIHQECYAWSLPHIDGMVAIKLVVKNVSNKPLQDVRIGSLVKKPGEFSLTAQDLTPADDDDTGGITAKGILMSEPGETTVAVLFFATPAKNVAGASWLTGMTGSGRRLAELLDVATNIDAETAGRDKTTAKDTHTTKSAETPESRATNLRAGQADEKLTDHVGQITYGVSPNLGTLKPGDEVTVYTALIAVPSIERVGRAIEDAYRTVIGDGTHRMIPPPMSITCRTVWGTYKHTFEKDALAGVSILLENLRGQGVSAGDISFLAGIDLREAVIEDTFDGGAEIVLPDKTSDVFTNTGGRVVLHGRLQEGEFFDVILRPAEEDDVQGPRLTEQNAEQYWTTPGKLDEVFLTGSPNPFRESTTIYYEVPANISDDNGGILSFINPLHTSVKVYNVTGRLVNILVDTFLSPGTYDTPWDGMDDSGRGVASGVYYVKLQIGKKHVTKRLIQLK